MSRYGRHFSCVWNSFSNFPFPSDGPDLTVFRNRDVSVLHDDDIDDVDIFDDDFSVDDPSVDDNDIL